MIFSRLVSAARLPIVFKKKITTKTHSRKFITTEGILYTRISAFRSTTREINKLTPRETLSNTYISSTLCSLPPQTILKGIICNRTRI